MVSTVFRARARVLVYAVCALGQVPAGSAAPATPPARSEQPHLALEGVPPLERELATRLARYQHARQAGFLDWQAGSAMLVVTRFGELPQVHRVAAAGADREQLTFDAGAVQEAVAAPAGNAFAYTSEHSDHSAQVYYCAGSPGSVRPLTQGRATHDSLVLAHDGRHLAFTGNERDPAGRDIYIVDVAGGAAPRLVTAGQTGLWRPLDWSADDQRLLVQRRVSAQESHLYILEVAGGTLTPVSPPDAANPRKVGIRSARFAPDGRGIHLISDDGGEQAQLRYLDPVSHQTRSLSPQLAWDVEDFAVSGDGRYIAYVVNEDGVSRLTVQDGDARSDLSPSDLPAGVITGMKFDRGGHRLGFTLESAQQPPEAYVYDLTGREPHLTRFTHSEIGPLDAASLVPAERVHFPTWDRVGGHARDLSAYVYRPRGAGPFPVLISIHGGPEEQFRPGWEPFFQFLVNELGVAVIAPNVRGSEGYGRSFAALDNGVLRQDAVRDIGSLLVWIGLQSTFDRQRTAVMGSAYGGYMTLASLAAYGERLRGGIDVLGIHNFAAYLGGESAHRDESRLEFGDERDPRARAFLDHISPLHNLGQIRQPLLIVQGVTDPQGPPAEAQQIAWRLRSRGDEVWYVAAKDEEAFAGGGARDAYLSTAAAFLKKLLGGNVTATASP